MMITSMTLIAFLGCFVDLHAEELATTVSMDRLVDEVLSAERPLARRMRQTVLVNPRLQPFSTPVDKRADLEHTTLGKAGQIAAEVRLPTLRASTRPAAVLPRQRPTRRTGLGHEVALPRIVPQLLQAGGLSDISHRARGDPAHALGKPTWPENGGKTPAGEFGFLPVPDVDPDAPCKIYWKTDSVAVGLVNATIEAAAASIEEKGSFVLAVSNDASVGEALAGLVDRADECEFSKWTLVFVNENCTEGENAKRAARVWTKAVGLSEDNILKVGAGTPSEEASRYAAALEALAGDGRLLMSSSGVPALDCVLLGTAFDGHVGSIGPDSEQLTDSSGALMLAVEKNSQKEITMSLPMINAARQIMVFARGQKLAQTLAEALSKDPEVPLGHVDPSVSGKCTYMIDRDAGYQITKAKAYRRFDIPRVYPQEYLDSLKKRVDDHNEEFERKWSDPEFLAWSDAQVGEPPDANDPLYKKDR